MISLPPEISSQTVLFASSESRRLVDVAELRPLSPIRIAPESGFSCPVIMRNSVVLPAPFGPMTPTMPPGGSLKLRPSIRRRSPNPFVRSSKSMTFWPRRSAIGMTICADVGPFSAALATSSS